MDGNQWEINGIEVVVESGTPGSESIDVGDIVRVTFEILSDGTWLALQIEPLEGNPKVPDPPPPPVVPDVHPKLSFEPDEVEIIACSKDYTLPGTIVNESDEPEDIAVDVQLGFKIIKGESYVDQVTMVPSSWDEIQPGESHLFDVNVTMKDSWLAAPGESEVKLRIYIAQEVNWPDQRSRVTMTIISDCENEPPPDEPPDDDGDTCTGADPHPKGTKLANEYGMPYLMIMTWFCEYDLGFGEIDLMLGLSQKYVVPVEEVLEMRVDHRLGWGRIKQIMAEQLDTEIKSKGKSENNKNKEKPGKKKDD